MSAPSPRRRLGVVLSAFALGLTAACSAADADGTSANGSGSAGPGAGSGKTRAFAADNGEVTIPVEPKRVVATGYAVPVLLEAGASLVGISSWQRGIPLMSAKDLATYNGLTKIAGESAASTNYEAIASAKPDLIVIGVPAPVLADVDLKRLQSIAPVVAIGPTVPRAWRELSRRQLDAAGRIGYYESAKASYESKAAALKTKYANALDGLQFGHLGGYGVAAKGTFQREFADSWGTNIAQDIGVTYYGKVANPKGGSSDVSEYPSLEQLSTSFADADAITFTLQPDGTAGPEVQAILDSPAWQNLPAVKAGKTFGVRYTQAATYPTAEQTLAELDSVLAPLLTS